MRALLLVFLLVSALDARAIVIRHDRDDREYIGFGEGWPSVGAVVPIGDGVVTLIAPRWAITAAHVAENVSPFVRAVRFGDREYRIARTFLHPTWELDMTGRSDMTLDTIDIALLELEAPVTGVEPASLFRGSNESGLVLTFVGWGDFGTGETGPDDNDGQRRAATNEVNGVHPGWITFLFDRPPAGTPLEGISGPGDSGGPALLDVNGRALVVGIGSFNDDMGTHIPECRYGTTEFYARVSTSLGWIESVLKGSGGEGRGWEDAADLDGGNWPATPAATVARAFFRAYGSGDVKSLRKFERRHRMAAALETRPAAERATRWLELREQWNDLEAVRYVSAGGRDLFVLAKAAGTGEWFNLRFRLQPEGKAKLQYISIAWDRPPGPPGATRRIERDSPAP